MAILVVFKIPKVSSHVGYAIGVMITIAAAISDSITIVDTDNINNNLWFLLVFNMDPKKSRPNPII